MSVNNEVSVKQQNSHPNYSIPNRVTGGFIVYEGQVDNSVEQLRWLKRENSCLPTSSKMMQF